MVQFNENSYSIVIETGVVNPVEEWQELQLEILNVLSVLDTETNCLPMPFRLVNLLRDMQPDLDMAKKMAK